MDSEYQFLIRDHEELFERKYLAVIIVSPTLKNVDYYLSKMTTSTQKNLFQNALVEIRRRLPQIPFQE